MKPIQINRQNIFTTPQNYQFIPMGDPTKIFGQGGLLDQMKDRIFRKNNAPVEDFWATLGRQDGAAIDWTGTILCSGNGNDKSLGVTANEITILKGINPQIAANGQRALEKVIVFDGVKFGASPASSDIRLTVMLQPGQGAIVYYQLTTTDDTNSVNGDVQYINPQETPNYNDNQRDRLDYFFTVPQGMPANSRFIVKVVTFARNPAETPAALLQRLENPYRLLRFDAATNAFIDISATGIPAAQRTLKTLLLIHGTFSTTAKSYSGLIQQMPNSNGTSTSWLQDILAAGTYDQVIALDHPTIVAGPADNVQMLVKLIGPGPKFSEKIHIITTSRGGLVGKTIVNDKSIDAQLFTVERMAAQACANGSVYFTTGAKISQGLAILKKLFVMSGRGGAEIFTVIAQCGVNFFLAQPGCVAMTIGSAPLTTILKGVPANAGMRYFPVTGNFDPDTLKEDLINVLVKACYNGAPNDWVIGTAQQAIMPAANYAYGQTKKWGYDYYFANTFDSMHTKYLNMDTPPAGQVHPGIPRDTIKAFLQDSYQNIL